MTKYKNFNELSSRGEIGDFVFFNNYRDIWLCYPVRSTYLDATIEPNKEVVYFLKNIVHLPIHTNDNSENSETRNPSWLWNGDMDNPTLSPSINVVGIWHGYFEGGVIRTV